MRKFINLSPKESEGIDEIICRNAYRLKKSAEILVKQNNNYSIGLSILILSSEEIVKAILVFMHSKSLQVYKIKDAKKFFSDHKIRHGVAQMIEVGNGLFESISLWESRHERKKLFVTKNKKLNSFLNTINDIIKSSAPAVESYENVYKIQEFNDLKNKGLYVDYKNELLDPIDISLSTYQESKIIIDKIFRFYKLLRILYHPSLYKHLPQKDIVKNKEDLKLLISSIQDFDFKSN